MSMMALNRVRRQRKRTDSILTVEAQGEGMLCFGADGSWFRGMLESTDDRYFDLTGHIVEDDFNEKYPALARLPVAEVSEDSADEERTPILLERTGSRDDEGIGSTSTTSVPTDSQPSDSPQDNISPQQTPPRKSSQDLLRCVSATSSYISPSSFEAAMRALADVPPGAPVTYDVHIRDHEEATECSVRFVPGWSGRDTCQLEARELQFTAARRYRGNKADMLIQKRMGPALVGHGCTVFTGSMCIQYEFDYLATPKWCL